MHDGFRLNQRALVILRCERSEPRRMGHGPCSSFEARKSAHLPSERKCVRPGMTGHPLTARDAHHAGFRDARLDWRHRPTSRIAAMNAVTAPKSRQQNRLEGFWLTALFQGLPPFATAVLLLKLGGRPEN